MTDNKKVFNGETLYQIESVEDCKWAKKGELGGYVAGYGNLEDGGWVGKIGCVCDSSVVSGCLVEGLVAGGSVVEGKVKGVVIRNSFVDKDCDLDCAWVINSSVYNSSCSPMYYKEEQLTLVMITNSCINDTEMYGFVNVVRSSIEKSYLEWQHLIFMNIEDGYLMEDYVDDDFEKTMKADEKNSLKKNDFDEIVTYDHVVADGDVYLLYKLYYYKQIDRNRDNFDVFIYLRQNSSHSCLTCTRIT